MLKNMVYEIEKELSLIEDYMFSKSKKYGEFCFDGQEYNCFEMEQKGYYVYGDDYTDKAYYTGRAFCIDKVEILESLDGAENLKDFDFWIDVYSYTKNQYGEVIEVNYDTVFLWDQEKKEAA